MLLADGGPFRSFQGEGKYTGCNTIWVRFFGCNLQCDGFGQEDPCNPETYELPYKTFDISNITRVEDLPVFDKGCDSSYAWSKKYKHLISEYSTNEVVDLIENLLKGTYNKFHKNMDGRFITDRHLCFTGGEPLLKKNQQNIIDIMYELKSRNNLPSNITFETNGTQQLTDNFIDMLSEFKNSINFHVSCSPKLFSVSGEHADKALKADVLEHYNRTFDEISLKFVMNSNKDSWEELEFFLSKLDFYTSNIYIMPVGATKESQEEDIIPVICNNALDRGFHVSGRLHTYIYGNTIGT